MSDADRPAYRRAHREKERRGGAGPIDGGALAIGLLGVILALAAIAGIRPGSLLGASILVLGAAVGGYLTGRTMADTAGCVLCHTTAMVVLATAMAAVIGGAARFADPEQLAFVYITWDGSVQVLTIVVAIFLAGVGGWLGAARKP